MKIQTEASNVLQRASANLRAGLLREKPVWFDVVSKYPPNHNFIKVAHMNESNTKDLRKKQLVFKRILHHHHHNKFIKLVNLL